MNLQRICKNTASVILALSVLTVTVHAQAPYRSHSNPDKKIALTFDDGPHPEYTGEILDILKEYGIKATFFVIGTNCSQNGDIVKREIEEQHEIGNHTYSHPHLTGICSEKLCREIRDTEKVLYEIAEYRPHLFRPPEGVYSATVSGAVDELNYIPILWTVDTGDWRSPPVESIVRNVLNNTKAGTIILCHDYVSGHSNTPAALRIFIPKLLEEGYNFVTVSELLASDPVSGNNTGSSGLEDTVQTPE